MTKTKFVGWDGHRTPETLIIMLTKKCNISCKYCYVNKNNKGSELSEPGLRKKITEIFSKIPSINSVSFSGGEPLLRYEIIKNLIEHIKSRWKDRNIGFVINTNATLLDKEMITFFNKNSVHLIISLDGTKETNDSFRRSREFPSVYDKIRNKLQLLSQIENSVNIVITPETCSRLTTNFNHLVKLGFKKFNFNPDVDADWSKKDAINFKRSFKELIQSYILNYQNYKDVVLLNLKNFIRESHKEGSNICSQIVLSNCGVVYPCRSIPSRTSNAQKEYEIKTKEKIDLSKRESILRGIKEKINNQNKECKGCYIKPFCFCPLDVFFDCKFNNKNFSKRMDSLCKLSKVNYEVLSEAKDVLMYSCNAPSEYFEKPQIKIDKKIHQMWFSITEDCANRCSYCFVKKKETAMNFSVLDKALDMLIQSKGTRKKAIIFGGEPTLHFGIVKELVKVGKRKAVLAGKSIKFGIGTNAVETNKEQIDFYKKNNIQLSVTFDGKKETHDKYRVTKEGLPTYNVAKRNLSILQSNIKGNNLCCLFGVHYNEAEHMFDNFMHIIKELKIESTNIEPLQNHKWTKRDIEFFKYNLIRIFNRLLSDIKKGNFFYINALNRILRSKLTNEKGVYPFYKNLVIFSDGSITANPFLYHIDKKYIVGNVDDGIKSITKNQLGFALSRDIIDFKIISIRNHFCNKMADYLIMESRNNKTIKRYVEEAIKRIFE